MRGLGCPLPLPCLAGLCFALGAHIDTSSTTLDSSPSVSQLPDHSHNDHVVHPTYPCCLSLLELLQSGTSSQSVQVGQLSPWKAMPGVLGCSLLWGPKGAGASSAKALAVGQEGAERLISCQIYQREQREGGGGRSSCHPSSGGLRAENNGTTLEQEGGKATRAWRDGHYSITKWILPPGTLPLAPGSLPRFLGEDVEHGGCGQPSRPSPLPGFFLCWHPCGGFG